MGAGGPFHGGAGGQKVKQEVCSRGRGSRPGASAVLASYWTPVCWDKRIRGWEEVGEEEEEESRDLLTYSAQEEVDIHPSCHVRCNQSSLRRQRNVSAPSSSRQTSPEKETVTITSYCQGGWFTFKLIVVMEKMVARWLVRSMVRVLVEINLSFNHLLQDWVYI